MAGTARPSGVGSEGTIKILSSLVEGAGISTLFDGVLGTAVTDGLLLNIGGHIEFECTDKVKVWANGIPYTDGGGAAGQSLILKKHNGSDYQEIGRYTTSVSTTNWLPISDTLEPGTYRIEAVARYVTFGEWYIEKITTEKVLFSSSDNKIRTIKSDHFAEVPNYTKQVFTNHGIDNAALDVFDLSQTFTKKSYVKNNPSPLGVGFVFEQAIDTNKVIKKITVK